MKKLLYAASYLTIIYDRLHSKTEQMIIKFKLISHNRRLMMSITPKYVVLSYLFLLLIFFLSIAKAPRLFISLNYRNMGLLQVFSIVPMCLDRRRQCLYKHKIFVLEGRAVSCPRTLWTWHFSGCVTLSHWPKNPKAHLFYL